MGCDIHLVVQRRVAGAWEDVPLDYDREDYEGDSFWEPRSYATFAVLAGVRNDPRWGITPISRPRGVPADFECDDFRVLRNGCWIGDVEHNGIDLGEHSHSWVTLAELLAVHPDQRWALIGAWFPELESFGAPDDVRLVFGFDS